MVEKALAADGTELDGRKLRVDKVQKKEKKQTRKTNEDEKNEWFLLFDLNI